MLRHSLRVSATSSFHSFASLTLHSTAAVPELLNISNIVGSQIANVGSGSINSTIVLTMAKLANELLCSENSTTDGIVITHGTDTLEETAFFSQFYLFQSFKRSFADVVLSFAVDLTVNCIKPIVIVGAMRPSTAISAGEF